MMSIHSLASLDSHFSPFSTGRFGSSPSVFDFLHIEFLTFLQSCGCLELVLLLFGFTRVGPFLFLLDRVQLGFSLLSRSLGRPGSSFPLFGIGCLDLSSSLLDSQLLGFLLLMRSSARLGPAASLFGLSRMESPVSALDHLRLEPFSSSRSFA